MYTMEDDLKRSYIRNIECAKDELSYHFSEIKRLKYMIKQNEILLNALNLYQTKFTDLNNEREVFNVKN